MTPFHVGSRALISARGIRPLALLCLSGIFPIKEYHFHVYFDLPFANTSQPNVTRDWALSLRRQVEEAVQRLFVAVLNQINDEPRGPHPCGSYEVWVPQESLATAVSFFMLHRGPLSVLLHPLTRYELEDHTLRSFWLGTPVSLKFAALEEDLGAPPLQYPHLRLGYSA